jgi:NAD(P)-dependent dehydrogenase (short-subunit alcohol dehydrogenase family)
MDLGLAGQVVLVTGAGLGIGRRIALSFAEEGAVVVVNDLFDNRAKAVVSNIEAAGGQAMPLVADVTSEEAVEAGVAEVLRRYGRLDVLVNNAGVPPPQPGEAIGAVFVETGPDEWHRRMDVITYGVLNSCRAAAKAMIAGERGGRIVSVVSDAGIVGEPGAGAYSYAKAGVIGFSKTLAKELARYRITVNCVSPGATMVEDGQSDRRGRSVDPERQKGFFEKALKAYPLGRAHGRVGIPSDVADPVVFLASARAVWITGQVLRASGGFSIA